MFTQKEPKSKGVLIVDGHPITRKGHGSVLDELTDLQVVAECATGKEAVRFVEELRPSLVILGLNLTGKLDGLLTCQKIKALPKPPRVLICAGYNEAGDLRSCYLAGADSFLHKRISCEGLLEAVRLTAAGESVWEPSEHVGDPRIRSNDGRRNELLTPRQQEVLTLRLRGYSRARIARELAISLDTVKFHLAGVSKKLGSFNHFR